MNDIQTMKYPSASPSPNNLTLPLSVALVSAGLLALLLGGCVVQEEPVRQTTYYVPAPEVIHEQPGLGQAASIVVESDFYGPLEPFGEWVEVEGYGRCWRPRHVSADWRPYSEGRWLWTDGGWYWESSESWGWATFHYGRWNQDPRVGWYWVPGTEWAPAWVSWRDGGGYTGWAPLPPRPRGGVTVEIDVAPQRFVYVEERHFSEPVRATTVIVNNTTVINKTVNITNTKIVNNKTVVNNKTIINRNKTFVNEGPRPDAIAKASGRAVPVVPLQQVRQREEVKAAPRPRPAQPASLQPAPARLPKPVSAAQPQVVPGTPKAKPAVDNNKKKPKTPPAKDHKPEDQKDSSKPQS